jgi:putative hemolysin
VFVMQGTAPIHEVNRELGLELPEGPGRATIAGLVIHAAGTIPSRGALLTLARGVEAEVLDASAQRVRAVRLRIFAAEEQTD